MITRYKPMLSPDNEYTGMVTDPDGEWVFYEHVQHLDILLELGIENESKMYNGVRELCAAIRDLKTEIAHLRKHRN